MKIPGEETKDQGHQEQEQSLASEGHAEKAASAMMTSLNKLSQTTGNSSEKQNGDASHQDSNDSAVQSDYDDSASDENAKANCAALSKTDKQANGTTTASKVPEVPKKSEKEQEFIVIQENLFNVKISAPGVETFEVQVSPQEMVQELHQLLMDREDTCHRTCFSLQFNGTTLDNFSELKTVEGIKEGAEIKVVEEPYSVREARLHVRHVRELLHSLDSVDAYNGADCSSLSYINAVTEDDLASTEPAYAYRSENSSPDSPNGNSTADLTKPTSNGDSSAKRKKQARAMEQLLASVDCNPPDYVMPGFKDRQLTPMHVLPKETNSKNSTCLKILSMSIWNPPPGNRKLHGDLLYLYVVTAEQKPYHVTASARGFYVNQSDMEVFNPKPLTGAQIHHSLFDLLNQISPIFKRNFSTLNKRRFAKHPFERIGTPFQVYSWTAPSIEHSVDHVRAEDLISSRLLVEEHIPGQQTRDWNEEIAATRELPRSTLPERLLRERAMFKVHSDFVAAASRGAMMVIDGNVMAINPGDPSNMRMYIWNNIFFSLGFDVRDHYKDFGGNYAAFYAPNADICGVKAYNMLDIPELHTLGTVVIDYRGYRVTAQSIIPGILEREQEQSVVYGSIDFGKTAQTNEKYVELLSKTCKQLHICPHKIKSDDDKVVELYSSLECKGIVGNDQRRYVLDLLKTYPPDVNYLPIEGESLPSECQQLGFPKKHRHKLALLRPELIEAFVDHLYVLFMRQCAAQIVAFRSAAAREEKAKLENGESGDASSKGETTTSESDKMSQWQQEAVKKSARLVGSHSDTEFDIRFNPDIFSPDVKHEISAEEMEKQKLLIKNAARFLITNQIPTLVKDCLEHSGMPGDGASLTDALHERGIGVRYLGKILNLISDTTALQHVHKIGVMEVIIRSTKHVVRTYLQQVDQTCLSSAISHFLNCFLSSCAAPVANLPQEELATNKRKKKARKNRAQGVSSATNAPWHNLSPSALWTQIQEEALEYYDFDLKVNGIDDVIEKFAIQKVSLLRRFCIVMGIQLLMKNYFFDGKHKPTFVEEDVINIHPVVKHVSPRASDAYQFYTSGQAKVQQGFLKEGLELLGEALNLFNNVYGAIHWEISACYRHIARLHYMLGEHGEAISSQQKAVIVSERMLGIDHFTTITDYVSLALYCFSQYKISSSLKLLYRARYLFLTNYGYDHPEMALLDSNIGLVLHGVQDYDLSLKFLDEALKINLKYHGEKSLKAAISHHLVARAYSCKGEFRQALQHEKETYKLYKAQLGDEHDKTKESGECLRHLTQQAVTLQKTMNEIYKNGSSATIPPLQITPPSMNSVLDLMNVINGIIFIPLSSKDIEAIRHEVQRQQNDNEKKVAALATSAAPSTDSKVSDLKEVESALD